MYMITIMPSSQTTARLSKYLWRLCRDEILLVSMVFILIKKVKATIRGEKRSFDALFTYSYGVAKRYFRAGNICSVASAVVQFYSCFFTMWSDIIRQHIKPLTCVEKRCASKPGL